MEQPLEQGLRKRLIYLFVSSCLSLVLAIVLVVVMALQSFTGFSYLTPVALTNCSNTYYTTKYGSFPNKLLNIFIPACLGMFLQLAHCIMLILPLIKRQNPSSSRLKASYILATLNTLAGIIVFGHILSFMLDFNFMKNCQTTFMQTLLTSLLAISAAVILVAILQSIFSIFANLGFLQEKQGPQIYEEFKNLTTVADNGLGQFKEYSQYDQNQSMQQQINSRLETHNKLSSENIDISFSKNQLIKDRFTTEQAQSKNQYIERDTPHILPEQNLIRPIYQRKDSNISEYSLKTDNKDQNLNQPLNQKRPGPILLAANTNSVTKEQTRVRTNSESYREYLKMINNKRIQENDGQLIAVIRGKYKN